jgi:uncharacterized protein (TIGR04376 family)
MGLFDDINKFLEARLEEFLQNNPHLELQALEEQLRKQEQDTQRLIGNLQLEEKSLQQQILALAKDIQTWHGRIDKAKAAGRMDLANAAQKREAALLRQGNQLWGQMEGAKKRIVQSQELLLQIQKKVQEVKAKAAEVKATQANYKANSQWDTVGWNQGANYNSYHKSADPLEAQFQRLEMDEEIKRMKRNL